MLMRKYTFEYEPIPTEDNIEYIFQKIIINLLASSKYKFYRETQKEWEDIYNIVLKWLESYINNKKLIIDQNEFKAVERQLYELDNKCLNFDGLYAEDAYEWILQLKIVLEKTEGFGD